MIQQTSVDQSLLSANQRLHRQQAGQYPTCWHAVALGRPYLMISCFHL